MNKDSMNINGHLHEKKKGPVTDLISFTKTNFKWILGLNVKHETIKLLENKVGNFIEL